MEVLHEALESAASHRLGQSALRYVDKALWAVEKSARWTVPPPLEQEEREQELIRPLPWILFLMLLVMLRIARESISLINLVLGRPPLRSADVVTYIQGTRRYLRTVKYQGSRALRARRGPSPSTSASWRTALSSLCSFTMCFRRPHCPNSNVHGSGDEVVVVSRRSVGGRSRSEKSLERLMEKIDHIEADSDDSSSNSETNEAASAAQEEQALAQLQRNARTGNGRSAQSSPTRERVESKSIC